MRFLPAIIYLAFAFLLTWPLIGQVTTHVPLGSEPAETVPFLNVWTIGWNGVSLADGYSGYWDAPIFFPTTGAFAFSDPQPLTALPGFLLWPISPALAYNAVLLAYMTLTGYVTFRLLQQREISFGPALVGGLLVMALPYLTNERGVLQLQALFGPIWAIAALWILLDRSSLRRAIYLGLAVGVTFLTSEYYALLLLPVFAVIFVLNATRCGKTAHWRHLGLAAAVGIVLILPVGIAQATRLNAMNFQRSGSAFARTSAHPGDYLRPSTRLHVEGVIPEFDLPSSQRLYPGVTLTALAIAGAVIGLRAGPNSRRWTPFLLLVVGLGFFLSLGANLTLAGFSPLSFLHQSVPTLGFTRSAFRFAALVQLAIVLLAVGAIATVWSRNRAVAVALVVLALLELAPRPERLKEVPNEQPVWAELVAQKERGVVVHLPWAADRSASSFADTTRWMVESLPAGLRLVNGYSGFFPPLNSEMRSLLQGFPDDQSFEKLATLGVEFVVMHEALDPLEQARILEFLDSGKIAEIQAFDEVTVLSLPSRSADLPTP